MTPRIAPAAARLHTFPIASGVFVIASTSGTCGECGREHFLFVNFRGRTRCLECNRAAEQLAKEKEAACA